MFLKIKRIRGSALQFTLLIAILVMFLVLAFILIINTHSYFRIQSVQFLSSIEESQKGIKFSLQKEVRWDTVNKVKDGSLKIENSYYGAYQMVTSTSIEKNGQIVSMALVGARDKNENLAIYLSGNSPLVMVGKARISGMAYLSEMGVKEGVVSGTYFKGGNLIDGQVRYGDGKLPLLSNNFSSYVEELFKTNWKAEDVYDNWPRNFSNSFNNAPKIFYSQNSIDCYNAATGNIRIQSDTEVVVHKEARLKDVLLVAPIVRINNGFKGRIHVVATDSVIIEENVVLDYPSSAVLASRASEGIDQACLVIKDRSSVNGVLVHIQDGDVNRPSPNLFISDKAVVTGQLYCEGYFEHRGVLNGSAYSNFLISTEGANYINHLYNGSIIANNENRHYVGLPLKSSFKTIVQWLY